MVTDRGSRFWMRYLCIGLRSTAPIWKWSVPEILSMFNQFLQGPRRDGHIHQRYFHRNIVIQKPLDELAVAPQPFTERRSPVGLESSSGRFAILHQSIAAPISYRTLGTFTHSLSLAQGWRRI